MTTINAIILNNDEALITGDTLITRHNISKKEIKGYIYSHKKIVEANCKLYNKNRNLLYSYNLNMGFAGDVTIGESLKTRANISISSKDIISLEDIVLKYVEIFNDLVSDIVIRYEDSFFEFSHDFSKENTEVLIIGFCPISEQFEIYKITLDCEFEFKYEKISKKNKFITIGCNKKEINDKLKIINLNSRNTQQNINYINTEILNFVTNEEYVSIGGSLTSYYIYKNTTNELSFCLDISNYFWNQGVLQHNEDIAILQNIFGGYYNYSGIPISVGDEISLTGGYAFTLDDNLDINQLINYYKNNVYSKEFDFGIFFKRNNIVTKYVKKENKYYFFKNINGVEDTIENHYDFGNISEDFFDDYNYFISSIVDFKSFRIYDKILSNKIFNRTRLFNKEFEDDIVIIYRTNHSI